MGPRVRLLQMPTTKRSSKRAALPPRVRWTVAGAALLVATLLSLNVIDLLSGESAGDDVGISVEDVLEDTEQHLRDSVTISGRVREVADGALAVGRDGPDDQLLLITTAHTRGSATEGQVVRIVGTVRRFDRELFRALRHQFDASLGAALLDPYEGRPAVVVRWIGPPAS